MSNFADFIVTGNLLRDAEVASDALDGGTRVGLDVASTRFRRVEGEDGRARFEREDEPTVVSVGVYGAAAEQAERDALAGRLRRGARVWARGTYKTVAGPGGKGRRHVFRVDGRERLGRVNAAYVSGRVFAHPQLGRTEAGAAVVAFRLAVEDAGGGESLIPCVVYGARGERLMGLLEPGAEVLVAGALRQRPKAVGDGERVEIVVQNVELGDRG